MMLQPEPQGKESLQHGLAQVWRGSPLWRFTLLAALVVSGVALFAPPWALHGARKPAPEQKVATVGAAATVSATPAAVLSVPPTSTATSEAPKAAPMPISSVSESLPVHATANHPAPAESDLTSEGGGPALSTQVAPGASISHAAQGLAPVPAQEASELGRAITPQIAAADENCGTGGPMGVPLTDPDRIWGRVVGFLSRAQALALIPVTERRVNGKIEPAYVDNLRVLIHPDHWPAGRNVPVLVPQGMLVHFDEHIEAVASHASPTLACHYVPNLIIATSAGQNQER